MDCPFCNQSIENAVFGKTRYSRAVYNISPLLPGHTLIVPKRHVCNVYELSSNEFEDMMFFMRGVSHLLRRAYVADAINWTLQE
ncbi:MAG: HIT family protein [Bacteroidota bacterium]